MPEDAIQRSRWCRVGLAEVHAGRRERRFPAFHGKGTRDGAHALIDFVQRLLWHDGGEGCEVGLLARVEEASPHVGRDEVEHTECRKSEHEFDGLDHAWLVVERAVDCNASGEGACDQRDGSMSVDMIDAILGVILHDKYRHRLPETRMGEPFDHAAQREVVVRHARLRRAPTRRRPHGVIARQNHHDEVWHRRARLPLAEVLEEHVGLDDIGRLLRPPRVFANEDTVEGGNRRTRIVPALEQRTEKRRVVWLAVAILGEQFCANRGHRIGGRRRILAEYGNALAHGLRRLPEKPARGIRKRIIPLGRITAPEVEWPHGILGFVCLCEPLMAIGRVSTRGEKVVEENELFGQCMRIGRDVASVHHECGVACALADVAQHLIVRAVLLDDVHDVVDERTLAGTLGNRPRRDVCARCDARSVG